MRFYGQVAGGIALMTVLTCAGWAQGFAGYAEPGFATAGTATAGVVTGPAGNSYLPYVEQAQAAAKAKAIPLTGALPVMPQGMAAGGSYVIVNHGSFNGAAPIVYCPPAAVAVRPRPVHQQLAGHNPLVYAFPAGELNPPQAPLVAVAPGGYAPGQISANGRAVGGSAVGGSAIVGGW